MVGLTQDTHCQAIAVTDTPIGERLFTDEEVRAILKRAVGKGPPSRTAAPREGLSLADLQAIGREVGIDPARLEHAAMAVAHGETAWSDRLLGTPRVVHVERSVEGEFDPEATPEVLALIRRVMGHHGEVSEVRGSLEWRATSDAADRLVTLSSRDGTTTISASADLSGPAVLTYLPFGIVGFVGSLAGLATFLKSGSQTGLIVLAVVLLVVLPLLYPLLRSILRTVARSESAKLQRVVDELERLTEGSGGANISDSPS